MSSPYAQKPVSVDAKNERAPRDNPKPQKPQSKKPASTKPAPTRVNGTEPHVEPGKPQYHGTSLKPYYPGQKPDHYIGGRGGVLPVYVLGKKMDNVPVRTTVLGAPARGSSEEQSQRDLQKFYKQNHPVGQQILEGVANTVPGVSLAKAIRDHQLSIGALGNEAVNDVTALAPELKAAGILGGLGGLRRLKAGVEAADAVKTAGVAGAEGDALRGALRGARNVRGKQEVGYSAERKARFAAASEHLNNQVLDPAERVRLAKNELRGELPKINFQGFHVLDDAAVKALQTHVLNHQFLRPGQKLHATEALSKALEGRVPTTSELDILQHVFGKETADGLGKISKHPYKDLILSTLNVPRSIMASFDLSAPFRQGLVIATRHPVIFTKNLAPMVKAFGSERVYQGIISDIHARPTYPMMMEAKLAITDLGKAVGPREERFASDVAETLTGGRRSPIRASGRAYTGFLDKTRADVFDHLIQRAQTQGVNVQDEKFLKDLGRYINAATGRGNLGSHLQGAAKVLNTVFFSPRLLASRMDLIFSPITYAKADPFVRKEALRSMFQLAGTASTLLALASQMPGVKVELDPRNPDWGKIKFGHTRIDIGGGFQQPLRLMAQLATGTAISSTTGKKLNLTANGFGQPTRLDLFIRFFEGKEAPWASVTTDWLRNSNQIGQPFAWDKEAYQHMIPLIAQDTFDIYKDQHGGMNGIAAAFAGYAVGSVGFGLQTYGPPKPKVKTSGSSDPNLGGSPYAQSGASSGSVYAQP